MNTKERSLPGRSKTLRDHEDAEASPSLTSSKRPHPDDDEEDDDEEDDSNLTEEQKKMKRVLANRSSARASYQRRKKMMGELQGTVGTLSKQNSSLEAENKQLREEISELRQQVRILMLTSNNSAPAACLPATTVASELSLLDTVKRRMLQQSSLAAAATSIPDLRASKLLGRTTGLPLSPGLRALMSEHLLAQTLGLRPPSTGL